MSTQLRHQVRRHLEARSLNPHQLTQLQGTLARQSSGAGRQWRRAPGLAAVAALVAVLSFAVMSWVGPRTADPDLLLRIADEVAANHLHTKPLEVRTGSLAELRRYFGRLDFKPAETRQRDPDLQLLGGRYCSLQGVAAAQLRLRNPATGTVETLYQAQYKPRVFGVLPHLEKGEAPAVVHARGIEVRIWVERGLVFAATRAAHEAP